MSALLAAALSTSTILAAGTAVDAVVSAEARTSFLSEPVADGFSNQLSVLGVTPQLRAAHQGPQLFLEGNYAPNLNLITPSQDYFLVMHRFGGQGSYTISPRLRVSADVVGAIGDLDAGAAVRDARNSRIAAVVGGGNLTQFPFGDVSAGVAMGYRIDPRLTFNAGVRNNVTGSPSPGEEEQLILPLQTRPEAAGSLTYLMTPTDSLTAELSLRSAIIADRRGVLGNGGGYVGLTPTIAYNRTLMNGVVASTRAGWMTAVVDEGEKRDLLLHGLPVLDGRLQASVNLSGEAAIEGAIVGGVAPTSDPLGGLLEERITAGVQGSWRLNRNFTLTTAVTAFGTLYAIGGNALIAQESQTAVGGSVGFAYNITEWIAVTGEALGTSRVIVDKFGRLNELRPDATFVIGITGAMNLLHLGERPAGTDPRPGRSVGTRPVALPGTAKAFNGKPDKKKKPKLTKRDIDELAKKGLLDDDEILDRLRRGGRVDERRLLRQALEARKKAKAKTDDDASDPARSALETLDAQRKADLEAAAKAAAEEAQWKRTKKKKEAAKAEAP
jgi:hypothetical protein